MGLSLTLSKENNHLAHEFVNAYWSIHDLSYDTQTCFFRLRAYPSREAKKNNMAEMAESTLAIGAQSYPVVNSCIYLWEGIFPIADIFPAGIPLDGDLQKKVLYNFIKKYTADKFNIHFADVLEEGQN